MHGNEASGLEKLSIEREEIIMSVRPSQDTGMKPSLGLTGVTINAMALIAPGAFLCHEYVVRGMCRHTYRALYSDRVCCPCQTLSRSGYRKFLLLRGGGNPASRRASSF